MSTASQLDLGGPPGEPPVPGALTSLPAGREMSAFGMLQEYRSLGVDLGRRSNDAPVDSTLELALRRVLFLQQDGAIDDDAAGHVVNALIGMKAAIEHARFAVADVRTEPHQCKTAIEEPKPRRRLSLRHLLD